MHIYYVISVDILHRIIFQVDFWFYSNSVSNAYQVTRLFVSAKQSSMVVDGDGQRLSPRLHQLLRTMCLLTQNVELASRCDMDDKII